MCVTYKKRVKNVVLRLNIIIFYHKEKTQKEGTHAFFHRRAASHSPLSNVIDVA
jgi:hypothetical protein